MNKRLVFLDGLRGLAALYVMVGHARWVLWEGYPAFLEHPQEYGAADKLLVYFFSLFRYGHEAVLFFFVLSGFVIHLKYAKQLLREPQAPFQFIPYFKKRARRIYPPFLFALVLTFLLDTLGRSLNFSIYSGTTPYPLINENIGNRDMGLNTFAGNILFLYETYFPVFGTNGPAWSLKYEWWFYMLYPLFYLISRKSIWVSTAAIVLLAVASMFNVWLPEPLLSAVFFMMITWWMGVLLAEIYTGRLKINMRWATLLVLGGIGKLFTGMPMLTNLSMGSLFTGTLAVFFLLKDEHPVIRFLEKIKWLGDMSYTLYIVHFPILVLLSGFIMSTHGGTLPAHFGYVVSGSVLALIVAYLVHFITEKPFVGKRPA